MTIPEAALIRRVHNKWVRSRRRPARPGPLMPEAILNLRVEAYAELEHERQTAEQHERHERQCAVGRMGARARRAS